MVFDPMDTGVVGFNELLMAFSMSMKGTGKNLIDWLKTISFLFNKVIK